MIGEVVENYWQRRRFWHAALMRLIKDPDPDFWDPIRQHAREFVNLSIARIGAHAKRSLTETEDTNVRFAFQILFGRINNINSPGPIFIRGRLGRPASKSQS